MTLGNEQSVRTTDPTAETPPAPPASYLLGLLDSLPAALLVTDVDGMIRYAAGQLDRLGGRSYADLLGARVADMVPAPAERELLEQMIAAASGVPDGHMVGPARLSYSAVHGSEFNTEVWAVNRTGKAGMSGIVLLLLPESAYGRFDHVLTAVVARSVPLEQAYGAVALALRQPPVAGEAYFLVPGEDDRGTIRTPDLAGVPGPPLAGPWDDIWAGGTVVEIDNLSKLPRSLAEAAHGAGYGSVSCYAVRPHADARTDACLVVWRRPESKLMPVARLAVERAVIVASLVSAHRFVDAGTRDNTFTDTLTGLGNGESLAKSLEGHVLAGEQPAILYFDLDGFQRVNDELGRMAGDAVLRVTARRLASVMRPTDELVRVVDDKFAVVCNGRPSSEQMVMIAERVIQQLSRPLTVEHGVTADVGLSVGIALGFPVGTPVEELLVRADGALKAANVKGRGNWAVATPEE